LNAVINRDVRNVATLFLPVFKAHKSRVGGYRVKKVTIVFLAWVSAIILSACHDNRMLVHKLQVHHQQVMRLEASKLVVLDSQEKVAAQKALVAQKEAETQQKVTAPHDPEIEEELDFQQLLALKKSLAEQHNLAAEEERAVQQKLAIKKSLAAQQKLAIEEEQAVQQKLAIKKSLADQYKFALAEEHATQQKSAAKKYYVTEKVQAKDKQPVRTQATSSHVKQALMDQYKAWKHVRYRLGGQSKRGVDCSGFTQVTFKSRFNITLPRDTRSQGRVGKRVKKTQLRTGDLVFFHTGRNVRHVGVYLDKHQFLHASTSRGVMISNMKDRYWSGRYWQARRISGI